MRGTPLPKGGPSSDRDHRALAANSQIIEG